MSVGIPTLYWIGFHLFLLVLLGLELAYARRPGQPATDAEKDARQQTTSLAATILWVGATIAFGGFVWWVWGGPPATQFLAGYAIEETLSIDNLFVFLLLFKLFRIPPTLQPKVLFWGVAGAIVMRGLFIAAGLELLARFHWISYAFAALLLAAAIKLLIPEKDKEETTPVWIAWLSKVHPVSMRHDRFFTREHGRRVVTMLFLCLVAIELTDVVFALDSIPAVLSITRDPFLAYTSNILAVMGLRSLFFLLAHMLKRLRFLHFGLAAVLVFAAAKMLAAQWVEIGPMVSLGVIVGILGLTVGVSVVKARPEHKI